MTGHAQDDQMYLQTALDLLPVPAALYEWPGLDFVSGNQEAMERQAGDPLFPDDAHDASLHSLSAAGQHWMHRAEGYVVLSLLVPTVNLGRPTLVLGTLHPTRVDAVIDHPRSVAVIIANEAAQAGIGVLNDVNTMLASALDMQREALGEFNRRAHDLFQIRPKNLHEDS